MRHPRNTATPNGNPTSSLLRYEQNDTQSRHFYNPLGKPEALSGTSSTFKEGNIKKSTKNTAVTSNTRKISPDMAVRTRRGSSRVRVSSFFSFLGSSKKSAAVETSLKSSRQKKTPFLNRVFGGGKKKPKVRDDIYEVEEPVNEEPNFEGLDPDFTNSSVDPRQLLRNTPNMFISSRSNQTEDSNVRFNSDNIERSASSKGVDLFEIDRTRKSRKDHSQRNDTAAPVGSYQRNDVISFVGSGKHVGLTKRTTLQETTLPRRGGTSLHYGEDDDNPFASITSPRPMTFTGADLNSKPPNVPARVRSKKSLEPKRSSYNGSVPSRTPRASFNSDAPLSLPENTTLAPPPVGSVVSGVWSVDDNIANVLASQGTLRRKKKERLSGKSSQGVNKDDVVPPSPTNSQREQVFSGIWSVDDNVASVLASSATLKRKKKSQARASTDERNATTKTDSTTDIDPNTLSILAGPRGIAKKKESNSSFPVINNTPDF